MPSRAFKHNALPFVYSLARSSFAGPMVSGVRIEVTGAERLPSGGAVAVCNHASDTDPGILMRAFDRPLAFLAAPFMGKLPVFRTLLRWSGSVAIGSTTPKPWREQVRERLAEGATLVVFPEGQDWIRAQDFEADLAAFHPGFAAFAYEAAVPVVPMVIERVETEVVPFVTSPLVRRLSGNPDELEQTKQVLHHKHCIVHVLEPIDPTIFLDRSKDEAVPWLVAETRERMHRALTVAPARPSEPPPLDRVSRL